MCLENSKQALAFLKSLEEAGTTGLNLIELSRKMEAISVREFGSPIYVSAPVPLIIMLRRHLDSKGILSTSDHKYKITDAGLRGLKLLKKVAFDAECHQISSDLTEA